MSTLEDRTLALLAQAISLDGGESGVTADGWLEQKLGLEILSSASREGPIGALARKGAPTLDPRDVGRRARRRMEIQVLQILGGTPLGALPDKEFPELTGDNICASIILALTVGLGVSPGAACTAAALILRHLPEPTLERRDTRGSRTG